MVLIFCKLFNNMFDNWSKGCIVPFFFQKGKIQDFNNYQRYNIIAVAQLGFKPGARFLKRSTSRRKLCPR